MVLDWEIIQNKYTDFILYDDSNRTYNPTDYIPLNDITGINITFKSTSDFLSEDKLFVVDNTQKAKVQGTSVVDFTVSNDWTANNEVLTLQTNGTDVLSITLDTDQADISGVVGHLNTKFAATETSSGSGTYLDTLLSATNNGNTLIIESVGTGADVFILINESTALSTLGLVVGNYRGNEIPFGSITLQDQLTYIIYKTDLGFSEVGEGKWDVVVTTIHTGGTYTTQWTEYTYKQSELYHAKVLEYISRGDYKYRNEELPVDSDEGIWLYRAIQFGTMIYALRAALETGNDTSASNIINYLIDYRTLNPLPNE